jgi:4-coumarate--CoA ligase
VNRLVDENGNEITEDSVNGEVHVRSPSLMTSYIDNPSATREVLTADGWLKTGDIAYVRCGKWYIVDRAKV